MDTACDAKIRPFPDDTELACECTAADHTEHHSTLRDYAYPGSATSIHWQDEDRRTFRGDWRSCVATDCILPADHRGSHAS